MPVVLLSVYPTEGDAALTNYEILSPKVLPKNIKTHTMQEVYSCIGPQPSEPIGLCLAIFRYES